MRNMFMAAIAAATVWFATAGTAAAGPVVISNGVYEAHIAETGDFSVGSWNAVTGPSHPAGDDLNIMYAGMTVSTNYSALRVYGPAAVLTYSFGGSGGGTSLDAFVTSEGASPYSANGHRTVWTLTVHGLTITQDVFLVGSSFGDSAIYHTVEIANFGNEAQSIGWRNLYDWGVNEAFFDDGPANSIETTGGTVVASTTTEFTHTPAAGEFARVAADPQSPTYTPILGLGFDPGFHALAVTAPDLYYYAGWPGAVSSIDYTPVGANVTADSAGVSWWGRILADAYTVDAGGSVRFTQAIFGTLPDTPPPQVPEPALPALALVAIAAVALKRRRNG